MTRNKQYARPLLSAVSMGLVRSLAALGVCVVCLACCARCAAAADSLHVSDKAAAMTNSGVKKTVVGGSIRNPAINHLASVQDMAAMQADLSELDRLLKELGMTFTLEQSRDMTMFMPVDKAFAQLPFNIHELSWQAKWRIVQHHIIPHDVVDLEAELRLKDEAEFETWEGGVLRVRREAAQPDAAAGGAGAAAAARFVVNGEAMVVSDPPRIETFNGASYKINKVLLPASMTEEDLQPAHSADRLNPELDQMQQQRLRRRGADGTPSSAEEQRLASVAGTVDMQRATHDPQLPGSFRPDPLLLRSQNTPQFLMDLNHAHSRWDDAVFHRTPKPRAADATQPQDVAMGYSGAEAQGASSRIKVLGLADGAVLPATAESSAMTKISAKPAAGAAAAAPPSTVGMTFESSEDPEHAPEDPTSHLMNVLLGAVDPVAPARPGGAAAPGSSSSSSSSRQQQQQDEPSLFSLGFHPTERPKVETLGLVEGLLPPEELITHHWSSAKQQQQQQQQQAAAAAAAAAEPSIAGQAAAPARPPIAQLWQQISDRH